ncbi:hypothetical protein LOTGIDRAFT_171192 [Lottia gigantea]|uniref:VCBS repeat-containing protein n=1 Tax=Lottia gigantea TaxID=225164 RepID=V4B7R7_LOTGI|nr:hypothetical protein LOTGIDRAFT_171192 [Lottia gigantea]ESP03661.1 hypothetical protein LOTGIDRAFT_171192 [Lottia gigantea]
MKTFYILFLGYLFVTQCNSALPKLLGSFAIQHPGFTAVFVNTTRSSVSYNLLLSSFNGIPFSQDGVYMVRDIGTHLSKISSIQPELLTTKVTWPNEVAQVPDSVFGKQMISIADGFLVPFKTKGAVKLMDVSSSPAKGPYVISDNGGDEWFYHKVQWVDMDKDGDLDILTCRAKKPIIGKSEGQLLWLENPADHSIQNVWKTHVLAIGPDVFFNYVELDNTDFIFTSGYFSKVLSVYYLSSGNKWTDSSLVQSRAIDSTIGEVFGVTAVDINQDGRPELLVTSNNEKGTSGTVHIYNVPSDVRNGNYARYTLSSYFTPRKQGQGKGAPGAAAAVPSSNKNKSLDILLSGDDDGRAYLLSSTSTDPNNWSYNTTVFADLGSGTVGQLAFHDVDGDGDYEIFVPAYSAGKMNVYTWHN